MIDRKKKGKESKIQFQQKIKYVLRLNSHLDLNFFSSELQKRKNQKLNFHVIEEMKEMGFQQNGKIRNKDKKSSRVRIYIFLIIRIFSRPADYRIIDENKYYD